MTTKARNAQTRERSKSELRAALKRLLCGRPQNAKLIAEGYRISIVCVAREAGLTPQAVHKNHKEIATEILRAGAGQKTMTPSKSQIRQRVIRDENIALHGKIADLVSENATLLYRAKTAEQMVDRLKQKLEARERPELVARPRR